MDPRESRACLAAECNFEIYGELFGRRLLVRCEDRGGILSSLAADLEDREENSVENGSV